MSTLVPQSMSLQGKFAALFILWSLAFFWFALLAWALSTQRLQQALTRYAKYIDLLCCLLFTILGCTIIGEAVIHTLSS